MGWLDNILIVFLLSVLLCLSFVRALLPSESSPRFTHDVIEWRLVYCTSFCESTIASRVCLFVLVACDQIRELAVQFKTAALQRQNEDSTLEQVKLLDIRLVCFSLALVFIACVRVPSNCFNVIRIIRFAFALSWSWLMWMWV